MKTRSIVALALFAGILLGAASPAGAVRIDPGVTLRPASSWADVTFAEAHTFSTVTIGGSSIGFDDVTLQVEKVPRAVPLLELTITTWDPRGPEGQLPVRFTGQLEEPAAIVWFNLTGLRANRAYVVLVDGAPLVTQDSGDTGRVAFRWSSWSVHDFIVRLAGGGGIPVWEWLTESPENAGLCGLLVLVAVAVALIVLVGRRARRKRS